MNKSAKKTRPGARILIVDDHPAVREALVQRIGRQRDLEVCGEAADTAEALRLADKARPDLAVIDISLKTGSGLDLIKRLRARNNSLRMLVWSMYGDTLYAERALRAGAHGYITKEQATDEIVAAIRQVLSGKVYLSAPMAEKILGKVVGKSRPVESVAPEETLSDREFEVFQALGQGLTTRLIAGKMNISPKTVETYRVRIKEKLGHATLYELIKHAVQWVEKAT